MEFYGELGRSKGNERNGQISVNVESGISKASRGGNINVDTFISDHVVFFLEFVVFSSERERERELVGGRSMKRAVASSRRTSLMQRKNEAKRRKLKRL